MKVRDIYLGYDPREHEAYSVCQQSLIRRSSVPLDIHALRLDVLQNLGVMRRKQDITPTEKFDHIDRYPFSTEFAFTRFLVPYIQRGGWALFCDCDFLFLEDVKELFDLADDKYAVMVVKHDYKPEAGEKMDGQFQESYYRKNWSSLILWNCSHQANKRLTLDKVNQEMGRYLHSFMWLRDEEIGGLPEEWNHLVGHSTCKHPKAVHYTEGGPWFEEFKECEWAQAWFDERNSETLMNEAKLASFGQ